MAKKARHEIDRNGPCDPFGLHMDLFVYVSTFLRFGDVCHLMAVSNEATYKCSRALQSRPNVCVTDETVDSVSKYCRNITCMKMIPEFDLERAINIINDNSRIHTLLLPNSLQCLECLSSVSLPKLLELTAAHMSEFVLKRLGQKLESLTFYDSRKYISRKYIVDPQNAGKLCPELVSLRIVNVPRGNLLTSFATYCLKLRRLTIDGCCVSTQYIDMTISAPHLTNLTHLNLRCSRIRGLELTARSCPELTMLQLTSVDTSTSNVYNFLTCCPKLEDLRLEVHGSLRNCFKRLLRDKNVLENLTSLSIYGDFDIPPHHRLSQVTPNLKRFMLSNHRQFADQISQTLDPGLTQLRELDLSFSDDFIANSDRVVEHITSQNTLPVLNQLGIPRRFVDVARRLRRGCFVRGIPWDIFGTFRKLCE